MAPKAPAARGARHRVGGLPFERVKRVQARPSKALPTCKGLHIHRRRIGALGHHTDGKDGFVGDSNCRHVPLVQGQFAAWPGKQSLGRVQSCQWVAAVASNGLSSWLGAVWAAPFVHEAGVALPMISRWMSQSRLDCDSRVHALLKVESRLCVYVLARVLAWHQVQGDSLACQCVLSKCVHIQASQQQSVQPKKRGP